MSQIGDFLERARAADAPPVCWDEPPWDGAQAALHWLRLAPPPSRRTVAARPVSRDEVARLCVAMVATCFDGPGPPSWSSHGLETALDAVAAATGDTPEPLLVAAWNELGTRSLDRVTNNFCRALGICVLTWEPKERPWDLRWMLEPGTQAQLCLRYWTMAKRPELWNDELEATTVASLGPHAEP
ncbi:MAG: hypothetical protein AAF799_04425 [Myxococcota bacterium]